MPSDEIDHLLRGENVPDSIAGQYDEFVFWRRGVHDNIRVGGHDLMFRVESVVLLEFEIS